MKTFILSGGSGSRLWPLSKKKYPKQFLSLLGSSSLIRQTIDRFETLIPRKDTFLISGKAFRTLLIEENKILCLPPQNILLEPSAKNTLPAIALGVTYLLYEQKTSLDEIIFISPADHYIQPKDQFSKALRQASKLASQGYLVTFGIKPCRADTGYGYILKDTNHSIDHDSYKVKAFVEKPNKQTADEYIASGNYLWNAGIFAFSINSFLEACKQYTPTLFNLMETSYANFLKYFHEIEAISIDYGIMEKSNQVAVLPLDLQWTDIGSFDSFFELLQMDANHNITKGKTILHNSRNCLIQADSQLIAGIDLEDLIIIEKDGAILISKKGSSQKVKTIVDLIKKKNPNYL